MFWLIAALILVGGTAVGWACAWLVHRYDEDPETVTAVLGDARCEHCDHVLGLWETARAGGGCPSCGTRLPLSWFAITAAVPLFSLVMLATFGPHLSLVPFLWLVPVLVVASAIDIRLMLIPKRVAWVGFGVGAVLLLATAAYLQVTKSSPDLMKTALVNMAVGTALYFGILFVMWFVAPRGMGFGDVRFAAVLGLYLGFVNWRLAMIGLFIACLAGVILGVGVRIARNDGSKHFPFGPGLALGALIALTFYKPLLDPFLTKA